MRNRTFALGAFVAVAFTLGCSQQPAPAKAQPARLEPVPAVRAGAFEVTVLPTAEPRGPGMGRPSFPTLWTQMTEGTDGVRTTNPARTIQIVSADPGTGDPANFAPVAGTLGACLSDQYIEVNVRITNFYPERFIDPYVVITNSITGNGVCQDGAQPTETALNGESFGGLPDQTGMFGFINYALPFNANPRNSLAGSQVDTGSAGGAPRDAMWRFNYPSAQTIPFTLRGQVWGFAMPSPPTPSGGSWGGYADRNELLPWNVIDIADDLTKPRVTANAVVVCSVLPGADGSCSGTTHFSGEVPGSDGGGFRSMNLNLANIVTLNAGDQVYIGAVNRWNNGGGVVTGSFPYVEQVRLTGPATLGAPGSGATVAAGTTFSWTVPFVDPAQVASGGVVFGVCPPGSNCISNFTGALFMLNTRSGFVRTDNGDGSYTFATPPFSDAFFDPIRGIPGTYTWVVRSAFAGRQGPWTTPRTFVVP